MIDKISSMIGIEPEEADVSLEGKEMRGECSAYYVRFEHVLPDGGFRGR